MRFAARTVFMAIVALTGILIGLRTVSAEDGRLLARHEVAGQACAACHRETPPAQKPDSGICLACHGDQVAIAAKTTKADPNPHAPPHLEAGQTQTCSECHSVHKESVVSCSDCHRGFTFNVK